MGRVYGKSKMIDRGYPYILAFKNTSTHKIGDVIRDRDGQCYLLKRESSEEEYNNRYGGGKRPPTHTRFFEVVTD